MPSSSFSTYTLRILKTTICTEIVSGQEKAAHLGKAPQKDLITTGFVARGQLFSLPQENSTNNHVFFLQALTKAIIFQT